MRQSLAKGTRRAIRRAVGPAALETFGQMEAGLTHTAATLSLLRSDVSALARDYAVSKQELRMVREQVIAREQTHVTFLGRLRWVFTGQ